MWCLEHVPRRWRDRARAPWFSMLTTNLVVNIVRLVLIRTDRNPWNDEIEVHLRRRGLFPVGLSEPHDGLVLVRNGGPHECLHRLSTRHELGVWQTRQRGARLCVVGRCTCLCAAWSTVGNESMPSSHPHLSFSFSPYVLEPSCSSPLSLYIKNHLGDEVVSFCPTATLDVESERVAAVLLV